MKTKFFLLIALFLGISAFTFAQTQSAAPVASKDAPAVVATPDNAKTGECTGHSTTGLKTDCKWVDADGDGKCDTCKMTEKECKEACAPKATPAKSGCAASCAHAKECGKSAGSAPPK